VGLLITTSLEVTVECASKKNSQQMVDNFLDHSVRLCMMSDTACCAKVLYSYTLQ